MIIFIIENNLSKKLNNKVLLKALGHSEEVYLKNIYTDIDFSLGRDTTKVFFSENFKSDVVVLNIEEDEWIQIKDIFKLHAIFLDEPILNPSIIEIDEIFKDAKNNLLKHKKRTNTLKQKLDKVLEDLKTKKKSEIINERNDHLQKLKTAPTKYHAGIKKLIQKSDKELKEIDKLKDKEITIRKEKFESEESIPKVEANIKIDGKKLEQLISKLKEEICKEVVQINKGNYSNKTLRNFLKRSLKIFSFINDLLNQSKLKKALIENSTSLYRTDYESTRLKLSIDKVFETGLNSLILGNAGAGKTTSLQMYALSRKNSDESIVIWAPISKVLEHWKESTNYVTDQKIEKFNEAICNYLKANKIEITYIDFKNILKNKNVTLLLDSIDEAYKG